MIYDLQIIFHVWKSFIVFSSAMHFAIVYTM